MVRACDFGGKPDSVTAGRSSSQGYSEGGKWPQDPVDTLGLDSPAWVRVFCITIRSWPWARKIHNPCMTLLLKNPEKIPGIPSTWKPESKITNAGGGQHMFPVRSTLTGRTVRQASTYLFLRMKLLLENLKLCCGTHDMLVPMLLGSGRDAAPLWKKAKHSFCDDWG